MGRTWPALDVAAATADLVLAMVDDFAPTAVEERETALRVFFATSAARDSAARALLPQFPVSPIDLPDDDWARRSQDHLAPVTIGRLTIRPSPESSLPASDSILIPPSMAFGTGHHPTTRLSLAALQTLDLRGAFVLDVGTGSGVLAIAAVKLGAARSLGIDNDPDAIRVATGNLALNGPPGAIEFVVGDVTSSALPTADVVTANLTGTLVIRVATRLVRAVRPGGVLILSGVLAEERDSVRRAFANHTILADVQEDEWLALTLKIESGV